MGQALVHDAALESEKLDRWVAEKMPYISDRDAEDERADPTMDVDMMVRKLRLKWLGEVLRLPEHRNCPTATL